MADGRTLELVLAALAPTLRDAVTVAGWKAFVMPLSVSFR